MHHCPHSNHYRLGRQVVSELPRPSELWAGLGLNESWDRCRTGTAFIIFLCSPSFKGNTGQKAMFSVQYSVQLARKVWWNCLHGTPTPGTDHEPWLQPALGAC